MYQNVLNVNVNSHLTFDLSEDLLLKVLKHTIILDLESHFLLIKNLSILQYLFFIPYKKHSKFSENCVKWQSRPLLYNKKSEAGTINF